VEENRSELAASILDATLQELEMQLNINKIEAINVLSELVEKRKSE